VAGFVTFVTLYDVQPLLPVFAVEFRVSPAMASLALSLTTGSLSIAMIAAGTLSEAYGRKPIMVFSLLLTSALTVLSALTWSFRGLLFLRLVQGLALAGVPAVAMAYLGEEMSPSSLSGAMGLYISGNAIGGMTGRIITGTLVEFASWRSIFAFIGGTCFLLSLFFLLKLPRSSNYSKRPFNLGSLALSLLHQLRNPALICLYTIAFCVMGAFVTSYNYITFRLLAEPFSLRSAFVGQIFFVYLLGSFSSAVAGRLAERFSRGRVAAFSLAVMIAGDCLTLVPRVPAIVAGIALVTIGFFGTHSVASSWVPARAVTARGQASALYLFFYYLGSSICGSFGGYLWSRLKWVGVAVFVAALSVTALLVLSRLAAMSTTKPTRR
jgi:YNFM family putative membrane transporter